MGRWACEIDVAHALSSHLGQGDLDAALLADHTTMLKALVLAAQTLIVFNRAENFGAEESIALGLKGSVVDGLGLLYFTKGP